jgi:di/tricarboxylate transporter
MPSKGKRVAARQNNLRRRRGGANRATAVPNPAATSPSATAVAEAYPDRPAPAATATATAAAPTQATPAIGRPATAARGRRFDRPAAYNYVGSELTRIGIFSSVLVVVLVAVSFVL